MAPIEPPAATAVETDQGSPGLLDVAHVGPERPASWALASQEALKRLGATDASLPVMRTADQDYEEPPHRTVPHELLEADLDRRARACWQRRQWKRASQWVASRSQTPGPAPAGRARERRPAPARRTAARPGAASGDSGSDDPPGPSTAADASSEASGAPASARKRLSATSVVGRLA